MYVIHLSSLQAKYLIFTMSYIVFAVVLCCCFSVITPFNSWFPLVKILRKIVFSENQYQVYHYIIVSTEVPHLCLNQKNDLPKGSLPKQLPGEHGKLRLIKHIRKINMRREKNVIERLHNTLWALSKHKLLTPTAQHHDCAFFDGSGAICKQRVLHSSMTAAQALVLAIDGQTHLAYSFHGFQPRYGNYYFICFCTHLHLVFLNNVNT